MTLHAHVKTATKFKLAHRVEDSGNHYLTAIRPPTPLPPRRKPMFGRREFSQIGKSNNEKWEGRRRKRGVGVEGGRQKGTETRQRDRQRVLARTNLRSLPASAEYMGSNPGPGRFYMPQGNWAHACPGACDLWSARSPSTAMKTQCSSPQPHPKKPIRTNLKIQALASSQLP